MSGWIGLFCLVGCGLGDSAADHPPLVQVQSIELPEVEGPLGDLAYDRADKRLYVAASGAGSVEVIDLAASKRVKRVMDVPNPATPLMLPDLNRLVLTSAGDGQFRIYNSSFQVNSAVMSLAQASGLRYDEKSKRAYVGFLRAITAIDMTTRRRVATIELESTPASFQLEVHGPRMFVNLPKAKQVAVIDRTKDALTTAWPVGNFSENYGMGMDEANKRLFISCRKPAMLAIMDADTGRMIQGLDCCGDADDVHFDAARKRIYVSCGDGQLSVFEQKSADEYAPLATIPTGFAARNSLFVPETSRLYVAVPHRQEQRAEVRVFEARP